MNVEDLYEQVKQVTSAGRCNLQEALLLAEKARELAPRAAKAWGLVGRCLFLLSRPEEASFCFEQGLLLNPQHPRMKDWLMMASSGATIKLSHARMSVICESPRIVCIPQFLSRAECDDLITNARSRMIRSKIAGGSVEASRTSSTCVLRDGQNCNRGCTRPVLGKIKKLTQRNLSTMERVKVSHYRPYQKFDAHALSIRSIRKMILH